MAGTDTTRIALLPAAPVVILVEPQLGENIGMAARAMLNCGMERLRLVRPREEWPNPKAVAAASGADRVLEQARLFPTTAAAVADLQRVYATTARPRGMVKRVLSPAAAAVEIRALAPEATAAGILFGREAAGLDNDEVALADAIITVPLNPGFSSLNLGMAVLVVCHAWFTAAPVPLGALAASPAATSPPATKAELIGLFEHLEAELDHCGFLRNRAQRPTMVRNLRNLLGRAGLSRQEVRTLRGIIRCLVEGPHSHRSGGPPAGGSG
jgi:tRNA/rRNA methyltransferase